MEFKAEMNKKEEEILALQAERKSLQAALAEASKNIRVEGSSAGAAEETTKARAEAYQEGIAAAVDATIRALTDLAAAKATEDDGNKAAASEEEDEEEAPGKLEEVKQLDSSRGGGGGGHLSTKG
mmetsp:Transcript_4960/g.7405  ORF Transcript_4960/g.7405 Transcript_4960/m.7405 type:complete len:125 (-) Transcript_4960:209-583(-)